MTWQAIRLHRIRLVTFDALHTIITPRLPINVQYSAVFEPYLGALDPEAIKRSFKTGMSNTKLHFSVAEVEMR